MCGLLSLLFLAKQTTKSVLLHRIIHTPLAFVPVFTPIAAVAWIAKGAKRARTKLSKLASVFRRTAAESRRLRQIPTRKRSLRSFIMRQREGFLHLQKENKRFWTFLQHLCLQEVFFSPAGGVLRTPFFLGLGVLHVFCSTTRSNPLPGSPSPVFRV